MSVIYKNTDFILSMQVEQKARDLAAKYSAYLDCLCAGPYAFQREAIAHSRPCCALVVPAGLRRTGSCPTARPNCHPLSVANTQC